MNDDPIVPVPDCVHLGDPVAVHGNDAKPCSEKLRDCAIYGRCTTGTKLPLIQCCGNCNDYEAKE